MYSAFNFDFTLHVSTLINDSVEIELKGKLKLLSVT